MSKYRVYWAIDVDAEDALAAARQALQYQRDPQSTATVFEVLKRETHASVINEIDEMMFVDSVTVDLDETNEGVLR